MSSTVEENVTKASDGCRKGPKARKSDIRMCLGWQEFLDLLAEHKLAAFELDAEIGLEDFTQCTEDGDISTMVKLIADEVWKVTGYRFVYKKREKSQTSDHIKMFTFYCAQLHGEEAKQRLDPM
ncbi:hypothetical protein CPB84DRAFT_1850789 [Gymnopilus junonius]|uniref:Uncharacterized protein n=1 Tax=Gymnopilus junonius TaxID=109634 RepID=A0A9P5TJ72_GYMJU|nr:hypothetical protein CPB84DRAFT_1850789 [Gymnopilus junonius]